MQTVFLRLGRRTRLIRRDCGGASYRWSFQPVRANHIRALFEVHTPLPRTLRNLVVGSSKRLGDEMGRGKSAEYCRQMGKLSTMKFRKGEKRTIDAARKGGLACPKEVHSRAGMQSRIYENNAVNRITKDYNFIFLPNEVCDRIAIKDRQVFFIEAKKIGKSLTEKQRTFQSLVPNYIIIH